MIFNRRKNKAVIRHFKKLLKKYKRHEEKVFLDTIDKMVNEDFFKEYSCELDECDNQNITEEDIDNFFKKRFPLGTYSYFRYDDSSLKAKVEEHGKQIKDFGETLDEINKIVDDALVELNKKISSGNIDSVKKGFALGESVSNIYSNKG